MFDSLKLCAVVGIELIGLTPCEVHCRCKQRTHVARRKVALVRSPRSIPGDFRDEFPVNDVPGEIIIDDQQAHSARFAVDEDVEW